MAGRPLQFGIFPTPLAAEFHEIVRLVKLADDLGLDLVGIQDHPYQRRFLDTFTLMPVLLAQTNRIAVFPDVANLPLRGAAMIAKASATMNIMFPGRFHLGLGAGGFLEAAAGLGAPRLSLGEAVDAFEEGMAVIHMLWSGERGVRFDGEHHALAGTHSGPVPVGKIEIWSGAGGRRMLKLTGRLCDGWIPSSGNVGPDELASRNRVIDEAATNAGREPGDIRRLYNLGGRISSGPAGGFLQGDQSHWVENLAGLNGEHRMDTFILALGDDAESQLRAFAEIADEMRSGVSATL